MNDCRTRLLIQIALRDNGTDCRRGNRIALLVHNEAAVSVAVESKADISVLILDVTLQINDVLGL